MNKTALMALMLLASGCAQMLPAMSTDLGGQRYQLQANGNVFVNKDTLSNNIDKKAKKLCPEGYEYETPGDTRFKNDLLVNNGVLMPSGYFAMHRIVRCTNAAEN